MNKAKLARSTFVLDRATHEDLAYIARRMKVSRSELVRDVLAEPVAMMAKWVRAVPDDPSKADVDQLDLLVQNDFGDFFARADSTIRAIREKSS